MDRFNTVTKKKKKKEQSKTFHFEIYDEECFFYLGLFLCFKLQKM